MRLISPSPELLSAVCVALYALSSTANAMESPPTFQFILSQTSFDFHNVSSWSGGGGSPQNITSDSSHPFAGRQYGGGTRATIRGTRSFGSGYPYGATNNNTIAGRPFPYGVWPLYWGNNTAGSDEYGPELDTIRPGGPLVIQTLASIPNSWNVTDGEVYYQITDRDTALSLMQSFVTWCHVKPAWPEIYEPGNSSNSIGIENVIQYYRASSYALAFQGYNNSFARNSTASYDESDPLPSLLEYSSFRQCLDHVVANAIPIVDGPPPAVNYVGLIVGLVVSIFWIPIVMGLWFLLVALFDLIRRCLCC